LTESATVTFDFRERPSGMSQPSQYHQVNLESRPLGDSQAITDGRVSIELKPKQILTLSFD
jgi:hypothetical protein